MSIRILERPEFDNANLGNPQRWQNDNIQQLARFWKECGHALGLSPDDDRELDVWLRCQHDIELMRQNRRLAMEES